MQKARTMKLIEKRENFVIIEITAAEMRSLGFDVVWDDIRNVYNEKEYIIESVTKNHDGKILLIKLIKNNFLLN